MAVLTGATGELRYEGVRIAKCRDFSFEISRDALETTSVGDLDRNYVEGIRGATGSATLLYDRNDTTTVNLLNGILSNSGSKSVEFVLSTSLATSLSCNALLTQVSTPVSVGDVIACSVSFQITGSISGSF